MAEWLGDEQENRTGIWQEIRRIESQHRWTFADDSRGIDGHGLQSNACAIRRSARGYSVTVRESAGHGYR